MSYRRKSRGSAISEFGPALIILLVIMVFPMFCLLYLGSAWCCGYFLNQMVLKELSTRRPADRGAAIQESTDKFVNSAFGRFIKVDQDPQNAIHYDVSDTNEGNMTIVTLKTNLKVPPFITNSPSFFGPVPGLSAPMELTFSDRRLQEERGVD